SPAVLGLERFLQVVDAEPLVAGLALGERVDERVHVPGGHPDLSVQHHRRVEPDHVLALLHYRPPPLAANVLLQLDSERSVVPRRPASAVDLTGRVHEPPPLGEVDDGVDTVFRHGTLLKSPPAGCRRWSGQSGHGYGCSVRAAAPRTHSGYASRASRHSSGTRPHTSNSPVEVFCASGIWNCSVSPLT